jgi:hypothetical protein
MFSNPTGVEAVEIVTRKIHKNGLVIRSPPATHVNQYFILTNIQDFVISEGLKVVTERSCFYECDGRQFCTYLPNRVANRLRNRPFLTLN